MIGNGPRKQTRSWKRIPVWIVGAVTGLTAANFMLLGFTIKKNAGNENTSIPAILLKPAQQQHKYNRENPWFQKTCVSEISAAPDGLGVSYEISIFYHIGMLKNWREIVLDQLDTLERCGLGYMASDMTISYSNPSPNSTEKESIQQIQELLNHHQFATRSSFNISFLNVGTTYPYERPIMERMSSSCRFKNHIKNMTQIVFYFHNKGCSKYVEDNGTYEKEVETYSNIFYWRKFMEWFLLERPTLCARGILYHGVLTCGVNLRKFPTMSYSGNFWSASCDYLVGLPIEDAWPIKDGDKLFNYISAELWIGNYTDRSVGDELKFLSLFNIVARLYDWKATPDEYTWIVSNRTFLRGVHTSTFRDNRRFLQPYEPGNQTLLWIDYLNNINAST